MTANNKIDAIGWLRKQLEQAPDPIREVLAEVIMALMNAEADARFPRNFFRKSPIIPGKACVACRNPSQDGNI